MPCYAASLHQTQAIAHFAHRATLRELSEPALERLKLHVLDTLGCAIGALGSEPIRGIDAQIGELGSSGRCTRIGRDNAAPDRAALWNGALVRYVDFMDNYLGVHQTCHPSDTFASVLSAAEYADCNGEDFLISLAVAYQVFCRLIDEAPVQQHGFDHTVQLAYGIAAGAARALGLDVEGTAHATAIAGAAVQGLVVTRADYLSQWKGLQSALVALTTLNAVFLARHGISGPLQVLDGKEGFAKAFGRKVEIDWSREKLDIILHASLKSYNAEVHTQPVLEAILALRREKDINVDRIERVEVEVFKQAYDITGSGEEAGDKYDVRSKEQADHSLPYLVAVALLDGEVTPRQFSPERIARADVQALLQRVRTLRDDQYTQRYPAETPCRVVVEFDDDHELVREQADWAGFYKRPLDREQVRAKFDALAEPHTSASLRDRIAQTIGDLEQRPLSDLTELLREVTLSRSSQA